MEDYQEAGKGSLGLDPGIQVHVRVGKQAELLEKVKAIQKANRHTFPGTIARYLITGDEALSSVHFVLIWKDTEMPDETTRQQDLKALQEELADVIDWETALYSTNETLLYTYKTTVKGDEKRFLEPATTAVLLYQ